jgi:hypothetical protein
MPATQADAPIARVLGINRPSAARHEFVAANFLMQRVFSQHPEELGVAASEQDFATAADRTLRYLQSQAARLDVSSPVMRGGRLEADVTVENLGGHKLPTAFPSRRLWIHFVVRDAEHRVVFESGALKPDGSIQGNDNDTDLTRYEPHYQIIRSADEVQIYESILKDAHGAVTTGLLSAVGYLKDNRLLPHGFDKSTADPEIDVQGGAATDAAFNDKGHRVRYSVEIGSAKGPFEVEAQLWYQPIAYRWAKNLGAYDGAEPRRFGEYFSAAGDSSAALLLKATSATR